MVSNDDSQQIIADAQNMISHINQLLEKAGSDVRFSTEPIKEADTDADAYCKNMPMA